MHGELWCEEMLPHFYYPLMWNVKAMLITHTSVDIGLYYSLYVFMNVCRGHEGAGGWIPIIDPRLGWCQRW